MAKKGKLYLVCKQCGSIQNEKNQIVEDGQELNAQYIHVNPPCPVCVEWYDDSKDWSVS